VTRWQQRPCGAVAAARHLLLLLLLLLTVLLQQVQACKDKDRAAAHTSVFNQIFHTTFTVT
jgi:hypothetical protein